MKTAIVTGGTRGIGLEITKTLLQNDYQVIFCATRSEEDMKALTSSLQNTYDGRAHYLQCNIQSPADRQNLFDTVQKKFGKIDVLVNNAGVACKERLDILDTTVESVERLLNINLEGTFFMCQAGAHAMMQYERNDAYKPRIINISSISAYTSSVSRGEYCMSKAGISMVTKLFADRLADENIPVFEVRPGIILTDMTEKVKDKYQKLIDEGITPIKRFGTPKDVANCVLALCSTLMDFGTGTVINADGGFHIRRL